MLSARAYSFRQKSRLAISLSWVGGYANIIALISCGTYVSHVTGTVTNLGHALIGRAWSDGLLFGFIWLAFLSGACASALLTESARRRELRWKYVHPMALEMALLTLFGVGLHLGGPGSTLELYRQVGIISFAMGLQNATITKISGAVVRTTHLTGVTTDLGLEGTQFLIWCRDRMRSLRPGRAGRVLKVARRHPDFLRVLLLASIIGSFLFGVAAGTFCYETWGPVALALPVAFLGWIVWVDYRTPIAAVNQIDVVGDAELQQFGIAKSMLPERLGIWRISCVSKRTAHRAPDFQHWAERVPAGWRVVVLALDPFTQFDRNSVLDLQGAAVRFQQDGRGLIISGVTPVQYQAMMDADLNRVLDLENLCPDLEFAVARGIDLLGHAPLSGTPNRLAAGSPALT